MISGYVVGAFWELLKVTNWNSKNQEMLETETLLSIGKRKTAHIPASRLLCFGRVYGDQTLRHCATFTLSLVL